MTRLSASFGGGEETQPHPLGAGESGGLDGVVDEGGFVGGEPDRSVDGAGVVGSGAAGSRGHGSEYSDTGKSLLAATLATRIST